VEWVSPAGSAGAVTHLADPTQSNIRQKVVKVVPIDSILRDEHNGMLGGVVRAMYGKLSLFRKKFHFAADPPRTPPLWTHLETDLPGVRFMWDLDQCARRDVEIPKQT
jgi:hypothetical protein